MSEKLLNLLTEVRDACLYAEDDCIGVTNEPTIDDDLFDRICAAINELRPPPLDISGSMK